MVLKIVNELVSLRERIEFFKEVFVMKVFKCYYVVR